ncbi:MAG: dihydroorotase [Bacteroidetes bacterium]|nr:dihydroorotase [Bacteroidota bacterium]
MSLLIKNATIINESCSCKGSVLIVEDRIEDIYPFGTKLPMADETIDASGKWLIPGAIDDQVHFREPGATQKGSIATESRAAVAGGVTSFMDMPNNQPPCCTMSLLHDKYQIAANDAYANYAFYFGANNDNIEDIKKIDRNRLPGVKVFMGSSTGNMLVDNPETLEKIFRESPVLIATHCEEESIIRHNLEEAKKKDGDAIPPEKHPVIRSREACIASTQKAIALALKHHSRLHILHLTTKEEIALLAKVRKKTPEITGEICVHHLYYTDQDYVALGNLIKCNPAIKSVQDREALREALRRGVIQVVATDHAPHSLDEKQRPYLHAPSGLPLIQYALPLMFSMAQAGIFTPEQVVAWMCHGPALNFGVVQRGFIRKGYYADLVLLDPHPPARPSVSDTLYYRCGWNPLSSAQISVRVSHTFVNGSLVYTQHQGVTGLRSAQALRFYEK